jgi:hypothetical protein
MLSGAFCQLRLGEPSEQVAEVGCFLVRELGADVALDRG